MIKCYGDFVATPLENHITNNSGHSQGRDTCNRDIHTVESTPGKALGPVDCGLWLWATPVPIIRVIRSDRPSGSKREVTFCH